MYAERRGGEWADSFCDPVFGLSSDGLMTMDRESTKDALSIGLGVLFPILIEIFGPLVGLIRVAYIIGAITGG